MPDATISNRSEELLEMSYIFQWDRAKSQIRGRIMKPEYDFRNGERGKFHDPSATFELPVFLDPDVESYLVKRAQAKGIDLEQLVNELLRKDIALAQAIL
jgi:hypothetical protein